MRWFGNLLNGAHRSLQARRHIAICGNSRHVEFDWAANIMPMHLRHRHRRSISTSHRVFGDVIVAHAKCTRVSSTAGQIYSFYTHI